MLKNLKRLAYAGMFLLPLGAATTLRAQGGPITTTPTAEGTVIKNVASASFSDVNGNTYTAVKDSVSITVGFLAAPNPTGQLSYTPASPSTGDTAVFTLTNSGNGRDSMSVSFAFGTGLSFSSIRYNTTTYTLAQFNTFLATQGLAAGASLPFPVKLVYDVDGSTGGVTRTITLTQGSLRTVAATANWITSIIPPAHDSVTVSPDGATVAKVVSNGATAYTYSFTVTNKGNRANTFSVSSAVAGPANGTVTITGTSPSTTGSLAPGGTSTITVSYRVFDGTAPDKIVLSASGTGASDDGDVTVSVSKANLTFAKTAWTAMTAGTLITNTTADAIKPGVTYYYKLAVTNTSGSADAYGVVLTDVLPASLTYVSATADVGADWTITNSTTAGVTTVTATMVTTPTAVTIPAGTTRYIWIGAKISTVTVP